MVYEINEDIEKIKNNLKNFKSQIQDKTFLVTGGGGFLGSWFCDLLNTFNVNIICVDNFSSSIPRNIEHLIENKNFKLIKADICSFKTGEKIDYIIYMASIASPAIYQKYPTTTLDANTIGTRNMLELARKNDIDSFLFTSTSEVYGDAKIIPTPETYWGNVNPFGVRSCYDESKRCGEAYCFSYFKEYKIPVRIARIFNTYGPRIEGGSYGRVVLKFIEQALTNKPLTIYGNGKQTRSFCYVTDTIEGLFKLLLTSNIDGEVINIGNDREMTIIELARTIKKLIDSNSKIVFKSLPEDDPRRRCPDLTKAKNALNYKPKIPLKQGLIKTIEWNKTIEG